MSTAKLFMNGKSQAVRLPKEFRFEGKEVRISHQGQGVLLEPMEMDDDWSGLFQAIEMFSDDFMVDGRAQPAPPEKEDIFEE